MIPAAFTFRSCQSCSKACRRCVRLHIAGMSSAARRPLGPYSRALRRGVVADSLDGRSAEGRYLRDLQAQLIAHCGGESGLSVTKRLLIDQAIKIVVQRDLLGKKLATNNWTGHDSRTYGALLNALRLTLRELGLERVAARTPALAELVAGRK